MTGRSPGRDEPAVQSLGVARGEDLVRLVCALGVLIRPVLIDGRDNPLSVSPRVSRRVAWEFDWFVMVAPGKKRSTKEAFMPRAQIKDEKTYRKLRDKGESKEKAARIANAAATTSPSQVGRKGGKSGSYDDWSKQNLVRRAREIGIKGRSTMSKAELVKALRDH